MNNFLFSDSFIITFSNSSNFLEAKGFKILTSTNLINLEITS